MGKTLETKKRILNLLKKKEMTASELSRELSLSNATVSQHLDELMQMGAVEKAGNEHFKKLKFYRPVEMSGANMVKYAIGALVVLILASGIYLYASRFAGNTHPGTASTSTAQNAVNTTNATGIYNVTNSTLAPATVISGTQAGSCPMITYMINGRVIGHKGLSLYNISYNSGSIPDYVISPGSSGSLYISEYVYRVLPDSASLTENRTHYALLEEVGSSNASVQGISFGMYPSTYDALNNTHIGSTLTISANNTATPASYWLIVDGPCGGGLVSTLLTVGSGPYNGTLTSTTGIYQ